MIAELKVLPCGVIGPGTMHRVIAACQHAFLRAGAVDPSPKHGGKPPRPGPSGSARAKRVGES